jgi:hypothetical protein
MKHRIRLLLVVILSAIGSPNVFAQIFDNLNMPMYNARVKLVDELFARFNGVEKRENVGEQYSDRESNILMLFNLSQFKSKNDSSFVKAQSFAHIVAENGLFLNYSDTCWYAKAKCHGQLAKQSVEFFIYLFVEQRGDNMYKWVISDVEGGIFDNSRSRKHKELYIMPNAHEQSFSLLSRITIETNRYIDDYVINSYDSNALSSFLTLVRSGQLIIDYVTDVEFFFFQIPNYVFTVKHFERESMNVGWLISSLNELNEKDKAEQLRVLRHEPQISDQNSDVLDDSRTMRNVQIYDNSVASLLPNSELSLNTAESIVRRFGELIGLWCETGDLDYQKKAIKECNGKKGKECFVKDDLMLEFASKSNLPNDSLYSLSMYLNSIKHLLKEGGISFRLSDIKEIGAEENFYIISCDMTISGIIELKSKEKFFISKNNNKISLITSLIEQ